MTTRRSDAVDDLGTDVGVKMSGDVTETPTQRKARERRERIAAARQELARRYAEDPEAVDRYNARRARLDAADKRERERFEHLVLGRARPKEVVTVGKRGGRKKPKRVAMPVQLSPGIEEAVAIREQFGAGGTPETEAQAARTHTDSIAQLVRNGTIDKDQQEWADAIANVYRSIEADVGVKGASLEMRVDQSPRRAGVAEGIHRVRLHLAYWRWRELLPQPKQMVLDMIVGDAVGYTVAAKRYGLDWRRARRELIAALDRWPECVAEVYRSVSEQEIERARNDAYRF
ncbi:hypothetical protein [Flavisphingomonas formosensis]|uniref:hypothetical protein n=1 Tax=Flavisphingomonas formosensis TaxID=861534 RepID=UPI0012FAD2DD|nr:hypothetical protein [Sphingomonas formosensis]